MYVGTYTTGYFLLYCEIYLWMNTTYKQSVSIPQCLISSPLSPPIRDIIDHEEQ